MAGMLNPLQELQLDPEQIIRLGQEAQLPLD